MPPGGSLGGSGVFDTLGPQGAPLDLPEVEYSRIPYFDPLNRPDGTYDYIGNAEAPTTLGTRLDGVLRLGAGIVEGLGAIGLLLAPEPTAATKALGVGAGAVALDNLWAGAWQIWTGQYQETLLRQSAEAALTAAGAPEDAARIGATLTDLGANTVAAGAASAGVSNLAKLSRAKRAGEAARIPVEGDPDFIGPPRPPADARLEHYFTIEILATPEIQEMMRQEAILRLGLQDAIAAGDATKVARLRRTITALNMRIEGLGGMPGGIE